jgi:micrococcal nuclease
MTIEPWSPRRISNIANVRFAFLSRQEQRRMQRLAQATALVATIFVGAIATAFFGPDHPNSITSIYGKFELCGWVNRMNCVIDGDTIRHEGIKIRLADIDAPEISSPKCAYESNLGHKAKQRLLELINTGPIDLVPIHGPDVDRYGRKLRLVLQNGHSLGEVLVSEGLARRWDGARRPWC